eukprot:scaffold3497_cov32-Prasinocladus_malaysianus.AAC.1
MYSLSINAIEWDSLLFIHQINPLGLYYFQSFSTEDAEADKFTLSTDPTEYAVPSGRHHDQARHYSLRLVCIRTTHSMVIALGHWPWLYKSTQLLVQFT